MQPNLTVVVTGSVAAVKTILLDRALRAGGFDPAFVITPSARAFLKSSARYGATKHDLASLGQRTIPPDDIAPGPVLIAPATADILHHLAHDTGLGSVILHAARPLVIAPAMNFMMWQHPAVQENVRILQKRDAVFLGPVMGDMACGDHGYGRMAEPEAVARSLRFALSGKKPSLGQDFTQALRAAQPLPAMPADGTVKKILFFADDVSVATPLAARLRRAGFALDVITRRFAHYQSDPQGMEHIRLAEAADLVVFAGLKDDLARDMASGGAGSFGGCLYLASKRPVVIVPSRKAAMRGSDKAALKKHGAHVKSAAALAGLRPRLDYLVLGGQVRERVDSFRFYANAARPPNQGRATALALRNQGLRVTYLGASGATRDLIDACRTLRHEHFDAVLQLAVIPHITCPSPATHKISKTGRGRRALFRVTGNVDIEKKLSRIFPSAAIAGFDTRQKWFGPRALEKNVARPDPARPEIKPAGRRRGAIIVTTGRTEERLTVSGDVITNGFTGRQGQEIARALAGAGYAVTLISGPTRLPCVDDPRVRTLNVTTMRDMQRAVRAALKDGPLAFISAAAIADFGVRRPISLRLAPGQGFTLPLAENPSIVGQVARHKKRPRVVVSFAAQSPDKILDYAVEKFEKLGVDMTVANPIGTGLDPERNTIHLITARGIRTFPEMSKKATAKIIARAVIKRLDPSKD